MCHINRSYDNSVACFFKKHLGYISNKILDHSYYPVLLLLATLKQMCVCVYTNKNDKST